MEQTLIIIKPDAVQRALAGEVLSRFERAGFEIVHMRFHRLSEAEARRFYAEHESKPHFARLIAYMTSGPSCFVHMAREDAIGRARMLVGPTDPAEAPPGSVRGDLGLDLPRNSVHAADSAESAARELRLIFGHAD
ncbi:MAG: nucleoside-diphosphate kinase [Armatimonadota bacterium]|nr:nucleoside-diphosphate kinase [Armatimonadota bacterium]